MNKKEIKIMEDNYYELLVVNKNICNKEDTIKEFKRLMITLGLEKEAVDMEYKFFFENAELTFMQKEGYNNLREIISKYSDYIVGHEDIINFTEDIIYDFTEEHKKCAYACMRLIEGN